jgi:hypothetical protein
MCSRSPHEPVGLEEGPTSLRCAAADRLASQEAVRRITSGAGASRMSGLCFRISRWRGDRPADAGPDCSSDGFAPRGSLRTTPNPRAALDAGRPHPFHAGRCSPGPSEHDRWTRTASYAEQIRSHLAKPWGFSSKRNVVVAGCFRTQFCSAFLDLAIPPSNRPTLKQSMKFSL